MAHLEAVMVLRGHAHKLAQPCLRLLVRLDLANERLPGSFDWGELSPIAGGLDLRLSAALMRSPEVRALSAPLLPALAILHDLLARVQESAGWPVVSDAVIEQVRTGKAGAQALWVQLCIPSLHPAILAKALPWAFAQAGGVTPPLRQLKHAPRTLLDVLDLLGKAAPSGTNTRGLLAGAYELRVPVQMLPGRAVQYGWGARARWMDSSFTDAASSISAKLARNKILAHQLLKRAGVPVAQQAFAPDVEAAVQQAHQLGFPVVIKPSDRDGGKGVEAGLADEAALRLAYKRASRHSKSLILESHIHGQDYRLGVINGRLAWVTFREPAGVWGDGVSTAAELIAQANLDPRRAGKRWSMMTQITVNDEARELMAEQGVALSDTPKERQFVRLRRAANISSGGVPLDVSDQVHPDNAELAIRVARLFRLDIAGIDFITPDISRSWREAGGVVCEVNGQPQFSVTRPDTPARVIREAVNGNGRIPFVAVMGEAASGAWTNALKAHLDKAGINAGFALSDGLFIGNDRISVDRRSAFDDVQALLLDMSVEAVVVATDGEGWLRTGLPVDQIDLAILDAKTTPRVLEMVLASSVVGGWKVESHLAELGDATPRWVLKLADFITARAKSGASGD